MPYGLFQKSAGVGNLSPEADLKLKLVEYEAMAVTALRLSGDYDNQNKDPIAYTLSGYASLRIRLNDARKRVIGLEKEKEASEVSDDKSDNTIADLQATVTMLEDTVRQLHATLKKNSNRRTSLVEQVKKLEDWWRSAPIDRFEERK